MTTIRNEYLRKLIVDQIQVIAEDSEFVGLASEIIRAVTSGGAISSRAEPVIRLHRHASLGDRVAQQIYIAAELLFTDYTAGNAKTAFWIDKFVEELDPFGITILGIRLSIPSSGEVDLEASRNWLSHAAAYGSSLAKNYLLAKFVEGCWSQLEKFTGSDLLKFVNEATSPEIIFGLGHLLAEGIGVEQSASKAFECYALASEKGYALATIQLAIAFFAGQLGQKVDRARGEQLSELAQMQMDKML